MLRDDKPTVNWDAEEGQLLAESDAELAEMEASGMIDAYEESASTEQVIEALPNETLGAPPLTVQVSAPPTQKPRGGMPKYTWDSFLTFLSFCMEKDTKFVPFGNALISLS